MLVTFRSKHHASVTMFGAVAQQLLKMMGHSGTVPSALLADELPQALARLQAVLQNQPDVIKESDVPLSLRAQPLIQLLTNAIAEADDVVWDSE